MPPGADIGEARFWHLDARADWGALDGLALHHRNPVPIAARRGAVVRAIAEVGRHALARARLHGQRGELRQRHCGGREDQFGALGLVVTVPMLWTTRYADSALAQLRREDVEIKGEGVARLSPLGHGHINPLGRDRIALPEVLAGGALRPPRDFAEAAAGDPLTTPAAPAKHPLLFQRLSRPNHKPLAIVTIYGTIPVTTTEAARCARCVERRVAGAAGGAGRAGARPGLREHERPRAGARRV